MEIYYEILLKLANRLQQKTTSSFLNIIFRFGLQPYLHVARVAMKSEKLQQHKEVALVCEEGIFDVKAISNMLVPQSSKTILVQKPQIVPNTKYMEAPILISLN